MLNTLYETLSANSGGVLERLLSKRLKNGKEDRTRISERKGIASEKRPPGFLLWIHAASVGEAQSALKITDKIYELDNNINILMTTGTRTSAQLIASQNKPNLIHQYAPFDHPLWVNNFFNHWQPDAALWVESELWPNMLSAIRNASIPALLVNARLSEKSYKKWRMAPSLSKPMLNTFSKILCQTEQDTHFFNALGSKKTRVTDNIKYAANPLPYDKEKFHKIKSQINQREVILYASTHDNEEIIAANIHNVLSKKFPNLLTIIVPRHPERGTEILSEVQTITENAMLRSKKKPIEEKTGVYIVDTLGELGLFYRLTNIAYIGRSLSKDGGGGHNPIEAALLNTAILCGPNVQNLQDIYTQMIDKNAIIQIQNHEELQSKLSTLLQNKEVCEEYKQKAIHFVETKNHIIQDVMKEVENILLPQAENSTET